MKPVTKAAKSSVCEKILVCRSKDDVVINPIPVNKYGYTSNEPYQYAAEQMPAEFFDMIEKTHFCLFLLFLPFYTGKKRLSFCCCIRQLSRYLIEGKSKTVLSLAGRLKPEELTLFILTIVNPLTKNPANKPYKQV